MSTFILHLDLVLNDFFFTLKGMRRRCLCKQTVDLMVDKARYGEVKEARGETINSTAIPLIDTDCYSRLYYMSGFREKEQRHKE